MTLHARLPFSLDPLIAEAKQRMRRRRTALVVLLLAGVASLTFALWPSGGPPAARSAQGSQATQQLARIVVPMDKYERQWRQWIRKPALGAPARSSSVAPLRRKVQREVAASGARVVRLTVWRTTAPPSVELVVATAVRPAVYLKHDLDRLLRRMGGQYRYVQVVDRHGTRVFENGYRTRDGHFEGMVGVPPALQSCSPVFAWGNWGETPCPVK